MENRLTIQAGNGLVLLTRGISSECMQEALCVLADYEDTNLTPAEIESLKRENESLRANSMIQESIIKRNGNPLQEDKIITLIMENSELKAKLEKVKTGENAIKKMLYSMPIANECVEKIRHEILDILEATTL